ncbi:indolepyruvate oxidoreductase subunit beta [Oceanotoga sp. DSM 15011]|uniref:indolepyruvate oxidoreductase subunit beta n=1 Tax=Oceanotoga sp. DSM 15011 TaxID=2984951 RepID=UPI0021F4A57C|nr:indolepyruvate oxidoreductase subunit beta [Oceanotoga sp. DSM 15011]UYO99564.1 indolepyruvate oxidoreductase subunit beta [Oceanotoga sp. DSM 15011]
MTKETKNILLVGVGGQGIILTSKIISTALLNAGYDVKMSEVHGMAQRGGSVTTQIRYGEQVYSPIIGKGQADVLISFEKMEAMRWIEYLKPDGLLVINDHEIQSAPILSGKAEYPEGIIEELKTKVKTLIIPATKIAIELGNIKTQNIVLLAPLTKALGLENIDWEKSIKNNVKEKFIDMNLKAYKKGLEIS